MEMKQEVINGRLHVNGVPVALGMDEIHATKSGENTGLAQARRAQADAMVSGLDMSKDSGLQME